MKKEDQNTEYKQSWREEYLRWICGFANAEGGRMLIGVADDKKSMRKRGFHWENLPCPRLKMKDISAAEIKHFKDLAIEKGRLDASVRRETKESFVTNLHLHGSEGLSYAAALLFAEKAEKWIPGAYVKIGKFGEDDSDLVYHDDYFVNSGDPGDIMVKVLAASDAMVEASTTHDGPISGPIKDRVVKYIQQHPGCKQHEMVKELGFTQRTLKRMLAELCDKIEYRGSKKTGGYYALAQR